MALPGTISPSSPALSLLSPSRPVSSLNRPSLTIPSSRFSLRSPKVTATHTVTQTAYRGRDIVTRGTVSALAPFTEQGHAQRGGAGGRSDLGSLGVARSGFCENERSLAAEEAREECGTPPLLTSLLLALAAAPAVWPGTVSCSAVHCVLCTVHCVMLCTLDPFTTCVSATRLRHLQPGQVL